MKISDLIFELQNIKIDKGDVYINDITLYGINYLYVEDGRIKIRYKELNS